MTEEQKQKAAQTRHDLEKRRMTAAAEAEEQKAKIMEVLATVTEREDATTDQILEAARLAVELTKRY